MSFVHTIKFIVGVLRVRERLTRSNITQQTVKFYEDEDIMYSHPSSDDELVINRRCASGGIDPA